VKRLHIGMNKLANACDIIGIFDLDITSQSRITNNFLKNAQKSGIVENTAEDIPKSYVITESAGKTVLYLCQPNSGTLAKRFKNEDY